LKRLHTLVIALVLGAAAAAGLLAATRTVDLGAANATPSSSNAAVAARAAKLDRLERSLHKALERRPPKLPKVPTVSPSSSVPAPSSTGASGGVVYVQSQPNTSTPSYEDDDHADESESAEVEHEDDD
jgi:hypothetical protein